MCERNANVGSVVFESGHDGVREREAAGCTQDPRRLQRADDVPGRRPRLPPLTSRERCRDADSAGQCLGIAVPLVHDDHSRRAAMSRLHYGALGARLTIIAAGNSDLSRRACASAEGTVHRYVDLARWTCARHRWPASSTHEATRTIRPSSNQGLLDNRNILTCQSFPYTCTPASLVPSPPAAPSSARRTARSPALQQAACRLSVLRGIGAVREPGLETAARPLTASYVLPTVVRRAPFAACPSRGPASDQRLPAIRRGA